MIIKAGLFAAVAYGIWYWYSAENDADATTAHAENACRDAIGSRFDVTRVNVSRVTENANGFTIRATGTLRNGTPARLVCLTTQNGTVRDVTITHH